jgi:NlpC/P60 family
VRIRASHVLISFLSTFLYVPVAAQVVHRIQDERSVRLASMEEGEAIVEAAWELRRGLGSKPDCSHFVNAIYARVGLDYDYASSSQIFDGIDAFVRVETPQPGDLVVWQGHIGIVVDPDEHSFYSSVLSGFAIEDYQSRYWTSRGQPRFYRYLMDSAHRARLLARHDTWR